MVYFMASRIAKTPPPLDSLLVTLPGFPSLSNPNFEMIEITSQQFGEYGGNNSV
jgi:hypothetical protein